MRMVCRGWMVKGWSSLAGLALLMASVSAWLYAQSAEGWLWIRWIPAALALAYIAAAFILSWPTRDGNRLRVGAAGARHRSTQHLNAGLGGVDNKVRLVAATEICGQTAHLTLGVVVVQGDLVHRHGLSTVGQRLRRTARHA